MADLMVVLDHRLNIETPAHVACAAGDPQHFEAKRPLEEGDQHWAKSCGICREPLRP